MHVGNQIWIGLVMHGANIYLVGNEEVLNQERGNSTGWLAVSTLAPSGEWWTPIVSHTFTLPRSARQGNDEHSPCWHNRKPGDQGNTQLYRLVNAPFLLLFWEGSHIVWDYMRPQTYYVAEFLVLLPLTLWNYRCTLPHLALIKLFWGPDIIQFVKLWDSALSIEKSDIRGENPLPHQVWIELSHIFAFLVTMEK